MTSCRINNKWKKNCFTKLRSFNPFIYKQYPYHQLSLSRKRLKLWKKVNKLLISKNKNLNEKLSVLIKMYIWNPKAIQYKNNNVLLTMCYIGFLYILYQVNEKMCILRIYLLLDISRMHNFEIVVDLYQLLLNDSIETWQLFIRLQIL